MDLPSPTIIWTLRRRPPPEKAPSQVRIENLISTSFHNKYLIKFRHLLHLLTVNHFLVPSHPDVPVVNYPEMDTSELQSTTEMFKDMLNQKRNLLFSKLTSFDSDVSIYFFYKIHRVSVVMHGSSLIILYHQL